MRSAWRSGCCAGTTASSARPGGLDRLDRETDRLNSQPINISCCECAACSVSLACEVLHGVQGVLTQTDTERQSAQWGVRRLCSTRTCPLSVSRLPRAASIKAQKCVSLGGHSTLARQKCAAVSLSAPLGGHSHSTLWSALYSRATLARRSFGPRSHAHAVRPSTRTTQHATYFISQIPHTHAKKQDNATMTIPVCRTRLTNAF